MVKRGGGVFSMILNSSDTSELSLFNFKVMAVIMYVVLSHTFCDCPVEYRGFTCRPVNEL